MVYCKNNLRKVFFLPKSTVSFIVKRFMQPEKLDNIHQPREETRILRQLKKFHGKLALPVAETLKLHISIRAIHKRTSDEELKSY